MMGYSAVITTLNEEEYIADCIESLLNQTVKPAEIILIDAESMDSTIEIAEQYPITIYSVNFRDVYRSKRLGILLSTNNIVLCIDGDTWIAPDFVEKGLFLIEEYDLVTGHIYPMDVNPVSTMLAYVENNINPLYLSGPAYLLKKEVFLSICKIEQLDGISDACDKSREIPLLKFERIVKCPELKVYTALPSKGHKTFLGLATGTTVLSALALLG